MINQSLKFRLILTFAGFSVLLALFYWLLLILFIIAWEDSIFNRQLSLEMARQKAYYSQNQVFDELPNGMTLHRGEAIKKLPFYDKISHNNSELEELSLLDLHIAKSKVQDTDEPFYIVYSVADQEIDPATMTYLHKIAMIAFIIVAVTGMVIGTLMGTRITTPLSRLDQRVQRLKQDDQFGETESFGKDEIGRLAQSFAEAYDRSQRFLVREQRFTREVSHELRTPTAVIKGALDILELQPDNMNALQRIRRANSKTEQLIETFLLLGREENLNLSDQQLDCQAVCKMVIDQQQKDSKVPINFDFGQDPKLNILPPVFAVLVGNLLQNAIRHTHEGQIDLQINQQQLSVNDSGTGFSPEILAQIGQPYIEGSSGQGLGLSIVSRICHQFGWRLAIDSKPEQGSQVQVHFYPRE